MPNSITRWEFIIEMDDGVQHCWTLGSNVTDVIDATALAKQMLYTFSTEIGESRDKIAAVIIMNRNREAQSY